ncbi:MAG: M56 family metallopeptidase, partial [Phycisphaerales bacterium]
MISEILTQHTWLWPVVWQSTIILVLGLLGSFVLRRRAVRAHQLLLLALVAALAVPLLSGVVKQRRWGLLRATPTVTTVERSPIFTADEPAGFARTQPREDASGAATALTPPVTAPARATASIEWTRFVAPVWLALSTALLVRLAIRFFLGYRWARRSLALEVKEITRAVQSAKLKLGVSSNVEVRRSADTRSPLIWCWSKRPILIVPSETQDSDCIDWESVVCHELAHWKRRDHLGGLWAELVVCLLPWNPLSWWAQRRLVRLSEEACDDWVIASGQVGTRYARTLLGLTPQGRAALIPAVVSSKKGLASRVRRILTGQCTSPRSGRRWSLAAMALAGAVTLGIAVAQTRPAEPTGTTKTTLAHGAVIEQLASTGTFKGIVLDPNGRPASSLDPGPGIVVMPVTAQSIRTDGNGHFEAPWSPAWIDPGLPAYLVARDGERNLARLVTVDDPAEPVTITLAPALTLKGHVFDPNGQPIHKAAAMLSLPVKLKCWAPIASGDTNPQGIFAIETVPGGNQTYTL